MENTFKKLSEEIKVKLEAQLKEEPVLKAIEQIKAASDTGTFEVVISTADVDRAGEVIDQNGWDLDFYRKNPVVLWAHDYSSLPIGVTEEIEVKDGQLVAKGRFAPEDANPLAQHVRRLYDLKIVRAASVGFIPREFDPNNASIITKAELLEFSLVPVPANPNALSLMKAQAINVEALYQKGILIKQEEEEKKPESETVAEDKETEEKSVKAGRVLSEKNRTLIKSTIEGLKAVTAALQELYDATESEKAQGSEGEDTDHGQSPKNERSKTAGVGFEGFEDQDFHQLLRAVNTATSEALALFNKRGTR
jgi:HK97 family phage prohead protease